MVSSSAAAAMVKGPRAGTLPFHRLSASITSWFRLPDQGMPRYEMLCRGTAFCVRRPTKDKKNSLAFFTCSHVAAPWRWPRLYPLPWLEHVREERTRCVLHVTEGKTGRVLARTLMQPTVVHHDGGLDVCLLRLQDEAGMLRRMEERGLALEPLEISDTVPGAGQPIVAPGYMVEKEGADESEEEESGSLAAFDLDEEGEEEHADVGEGVVLDLRTDRQPRRLCVSLGDISPYRDARSRGFAAMDRILGDGVCGAPVIDLSSQRGGLCVGMVEGIVPPQDKGAGGDDGVKEGVREAIAGNAGFVYGAELLKLLEQEEAE